MSNTTPPPTTKAANVPATANTIMTTLQATPTVQIAELEFVKNKYINNYNACNPGGDGEMMYHRNLVFIKQAIMGFTKAVDPFSVYACITTMAVYGASAAPADEECYLIPREGKMCLQFQPGMKVKRLQRSGQIHDIDKVNLVFEGDTFTVKDGMITEHIENFKSDVIIAGYVKFNLPNDKQKHFVYRRFHWDSWRSHSPQPNGTNWEYKTKNPDGTILTQPKPGFLISKIISHACGEKSWTPGRTPATVEVYSNVIVESDDDDESPEYTKQPISMSDIPPITPHEEVKDQAPESPTAKPSFLRKDKIQATSQPATSDEPF